LWGAFGGVFAALWDLRGVGGGFCGLSGVFDGGVRDIDLSSEEIVRAWEGGMKKEERFDWRAGDALLDCGDVEEFWKLYSEYLERVGIVSNVAGIGDLDNKRRAVVHRAAKMTAEMLEGAAAEFDEIIEGAPVDFRDAGRSAMDEEQWEERVRAFRERFNS